MVSRDNTAAIVLYAFFIFLSSGIFGTEPKNAVYTCIWGGVRVAAHSITRINRPNCFKKLSVDSILGESIIV